MTITTRKPTCRASWPFILLAGVEGAGKTWAAVEMSSMPTIDRTFFIELGEGAADEYGRVPGADFEIIEHDGTVGMIREAIAWAAAHPAADGKFNALIFDSLSELWALLSENAQAEANRRAARKGRKVPEDGAQITMDLWNRATEVWEGIMTQLQRFPGPVVGTARLEQVTLMDNNGQPTKDKDWKIQAQKRLPYRAQVIVQARQPRVWTMTKIATTVPELQLEPGKEMTFKQFSLPTLLETMGVGADTAPSSFVEARPDDSLSDEPAPKPEAQPQPDPQKRREWLDRQAGRLMEAEKAGNRTSIEKALAWAKQRHDRDLTLMAVSTLERMDKAQLAQRELDAEVVEGELIDA